MLLSMNGLSIYHKKRCIVDKVSLALAYGEWHAVAGESGSGKSVTALSIAGLLPNELSAEGSIFYEGIDLLTFSHKKMRLLRGKKISYIFQDYQGSFTPFMTIGSQFDEMLCTHTDLPKKARQTKALLSLEEVGLPPERTFCSYPFQLSGGQVQRAAIAMATMLQPKLIIADEPTTALDSITATAVLQLLKKRQSETGCGVLFITHDLRTVKKYSDTVSVMQYGRIVETGRPHHVLAKPKHEYTKQLVSALPPLCNVPVRLGREALKEGLK
ncbi:ABC transporter ATP-binding protein [Fictibacillus aquaticus]|uniref:Dipeptide/oligopeptide/nickel ABC transporter ATP-binding protein n=1 Tax=Fictibacillus aquaticus TaxID=2021314 RepID=A0A235FEE9_9BACL|nr:ABC transporter ATP-binding protein [Fictibacillus aquaticus]OYD59307.1 dipeptide/oligopeptide/nickel ABC transporter ATP-binding protein [Fictibacillus aquaticus]